MVLEHQIGNPSVRSFLGKKYYIDGKNLKITDFIAQCNRVPFVIRDDILLKDTENIIAANKK